MKGNIVSETPKIEGDINVLTSIENSPVSSSAISSDQKSEGKTSNVKNARPIYENLLKGTKASKARSADPKSSKDVNAKTAHLSKR